MAKDSLKNVSFDTQGKYAKGKSFKQSMRSCANTETGTVNAFMRSAGDAKQPDCVVFHHHCDDDADYCDIVMKVSKIEILSINCLDIVDTDYL